MGCPEIFVAHQKDEKQRKLLRIKPGKKLFVIGSSPLADLKISGAGVKGCHAVLRYRDSQWYVCDVSGDENVRVNGRAQIEVKFDDSTMAIEIGPNKIQLFTKEKQAEIFQSESTGAQNGLSLHQVVVRLHGRVVETRILPAHESYRHDDGTKVTPLPAPKSGQWIRTEFGTRTVQQRLVPSQEVIVHEQVGFDRDLRKPLVMALLLLIFIFSSIAILAPTSKKAEVVLDKKSMDIIFNAKAVKRKKIESQKVVKTAKAKAGGSSDQAPISNTKSSQAPEESTAPKVSEKTAAALTSLRKSGLSNLIGKIAKRANRQGIMVAAVGVNPDTKGAGRAFYSVGTSTTGGGGAAAKEGPTYRLGGVATKGKAGGGNFKDGTALAGGNVGSGDIVAMVDEETVIEGGLDRDAIAEVIRRNLGQIRYCYERQLSSNPELYGKVLVKFTIGAAGDVSEPKVDNSTLKSAMVEGCIMRRLASWKFPEPKGGTQVRVSYPFLFKAN